MANLTLIVDNTLNVKFKVLENLRFHDGKAVSVFCALRNIEDFQAGFDALVSLIGDGLVQRQEYTPDSNIFLYRYRSELGLLRRLASESPVS